MISRLPVVSVSPLGTTTRRPQGKPEKLKRFNQLARRFFENQAEQMLRKRSECLPSHRSNAVGGKKEKVRILRGAQPRIKL
ncbi:MAG: hypothetical protein ACI9U2_002308, partial [Bradymonadia bacterium]